MTGQASVVEVLRERAEYARFESSDPDIEVYAVPMFVVEEVLAAAGLLASGPTLINLLRELIDEDDCWFDHHGGCQAHGYLSLKPGETCPQQDAKDVIAETAGSFPITLVTR